MSRVKNRGSHSSGMLFFFLISWLVLFPVNVSSQGTQNQSFLEQVKKSIVFLEAQGAGDTPSHIAGTGFLISVENVYHLVTAKHVVVDKKTNKYIGDNLVALFNTLNAGIGRRSILEIRKKSKVNWIYHSNEKIDIAIIPFGLNTQTDDVKVIPDSSFVSSEEVRELFEVYFLGYQPGLPMESRIKPSFRSGTVSRFNEDKTFYVSAFAFPGNSGSPVFLRPSAIRRDGNVISIGGDRLGNRFIGFIGEYVPYQEYAISATTNRIRVMFEENTGLSRVWSVDLIRDILDSNKFKEQIRLLQAK